MCYYAHRNKKDLREGDSHHEKFRRHQNRNKARYDDDGYVHVQHVHALQYNFFKRAFHHQDENLFLISEHGISRRARLNELSFLFQTQN